MKKQERYKLFNHVKNEWCKECDDNFVFRRMTRTELYKLLAFYRHSSLVEKFYCCFGLYKCCWVEFIEKGNWLFTQKEVDNIIKQTIDSTAKLCKKDSRILYRKIGDNVQVLIIARDVLKTDYLIYFKNEE